MKGMKRVFAILLILAVITSVLSACGENPTDDNSKTTQTTAIDNLESTMPNVVGKSEGEAVSLLREVYGLQVQVVEEYNSDYEKGTIFSTDPAAGVKVKAADVVTIYVATDVKEKVLVIDFLVFENQENIQKQVEKYGLKAEFETVASDQPTGTVFEQSVAPESYVDKGSTIVFKVSDGTLCQREATINVVLPNNGTTTTGTIQIFVDGRLYKEESVLMNGSTYSLVLIDTGLKTYSVIYKEGNRVLQEGEIDFTQETSVVAQKKAILPDVTGMAEAMALQKLREAGFVNITVTGVSGGVVKNQIPSSIGSEIYTTDIIYIELG
jgi:beta-lactam-binding protein with PASTA domain